MTYRSSDKLGRSENTFIVIGINKLQDEKLIQIKNLVKTLTENRRKMLNKLYTK